MLLFLNFIYLQNSDLKNNIKISILIRLSQSLVVKWIHIKLKYIHNMFMFDYFHGNCFDFDKSLVKKN